jgi:hypothetical protein
MDLISWLVITGLAIFFIAAGIFAWAIVRGGAARDTEDVPDGDDAFDRSMRHFGYIPQGRNEGRK